MGKPIKCPKCRAEQPLQPICNRCGFDIKAYALELKKKKAAGAAGPSITCPKCKHQQPRQAVCEKCQFNIKEYVLKIRAQKAAQEKAAQQKAGAQPAPEQAYQSLKSSVAAPATQAPSFGPSSFGELFGRAWETFKQRLATLLLLLLLTFVFSLAPLFLFILIGVVLTVLLPGLKAFTIGFSSLLGLSLCFAGGYFGLASITAAVVDNTLGVKAALGRGREMLCSYFWVIMLAFLAIWGGFMLFFIPGIILLVWAFPSQFIIYTEQERGLKALLLGREYVRGYWFDTFVKLFVIWLLYVLSGFVPFGQLLSYPLFMLFLFEMYKDLRRVKGSVVPYQTTFGAKLPWVGAALMSVLFPMVIVAAIAIPAMIKSKGDMTRIFSNLSGENTLNISKTSYAPGEEITVAFKAEEYPKNAWIGIIPSHIAHGSESKNDQHDIAYKYLGGNTSGTLIFTAPPKPGNYDMRMHDTDSGGVEVASISFIVSGQAGRSASPQRGGASITTAKSTYSPGERIVIEYSGFPGNSQDWITLVASSAPKNTYGKWFYTKAQMSGSYAFNGPNPGSYEIRGYFNWPSGGYTVQVRHTITVR